MKRTLLLLSLLITTLGVSTQVAWAAWPTDATVTTIADRSTLGAGYEPSGLAWHAGREQLVLVSDESQVSVMNQDGSSLTTWTVPGGLDLEGVAIADTTSNLIYLGVENPDSIVEFNIDTGELTGKSWNLTTWMTGDSNLGLEALTFVPNGEHPYSDSTSGGLFYAGLQAPPANIFVFDVDLDHNGMVSKIKTLPSPGDLTSDIADLYYSSDTELLYGVYDGFDTIAEFELMVDTEVLTENNRYTLSDGDQEGLVVLADCDLALGTVFTGDDVSGEILSYTNYPITCIVEEEEDETPPEDDPVDDEGDDPVDDDSGDDTGGDVPTDPTTETEEPVCDTTESASTAEAPTTAESISTPTNSTPITTTAPEDEASSDDATVDVAESGNPTINTVKRHKRTVTVTYTDAAAIQFKPFASGHLAIAHDQLGDRIIASNGRRLKVYDACGNLLDRRRLTRARLRGVDVLLLPSAGLSYRRLVVSSTSGTTGRLTGLRLTDESELKRVRQAELSLPETSGKLALRTGAKPNRFQAVFKGDRTTWIVKKTGILVKK